MKNHSKSISPEWQDVRNYYVDLPSDQERAKFIKSLQPEQQEYLKSITERNQPNLHPLTGLNTTKAESSKSFIGRLMNKLPFMRHRRISSKKVKEAEGTGMIIAVCSVFGIASFVASGLIFNYDNTVGLLRQVPVFGSVLGDIPGETKEEYFSKYDDWAAKNGFEFDKFSDEDKDGLTNIDEFIFGTDVQNDDENNNGVIDGQDFLAQMNPKTSKQINKLDEETFALIDVMDSPSEVHNRLFSYSWAQIENEREEKGILRESLPESYSPDILELPESSNLDTTKPIYISVDELSLNRFEIQLQSKEQGVLETINQPVLSHLFASPLPGEKGVSMITIPNVTALSSSTLREASSKLTDLSPSNIIIIEGTLTDGSILKMTFEVSKNNLYDVDNITYSKQLSSPQITLSTSWPDDTHERRVFITAKLIDSNIIN